MISKLYLHIDLVFIYVVMCMLERTNILINKAFTFAYDIKQANSENCGPPHGNKFDLEKVKGEGQGHSMVPIERACHKDHACQVSMLYH